MARERDSWFGLGAALLLGALACAPEASVGPLPLAGYNIVLINIDTLRADHLGTYGYGRDTSPTIDRLASEGVVFDNAIASSSYTRQSVAALLTGQLPSCARSLGWNGQPAATVPTLGERFRLAGYRTGFLSNSIMLNRPGFTRGFGFVRHLSQQADISGEGPALTRRALRFARRRPGKPFLLYLHYLDPHAPYEPTAAVRAGFSGTPHPNPLPLLKVGLGIEGLLSEGFGPGEARFEDMLLRYDAEIRHTDMAIAQLLSGLRDLGLLDRTALVITADHGEEFLEHGYVDHAWSLYRESLHVPLIFWAPGALEPARVAAPVSGVDVLPTLLAATGLAQGHTPLDGRLLLGPQTELPEDRVIVSELMIRERTMLRSVAVGDWKYLATYKWLEPGKRVVAAVMGNKRRAQGYATPMDPWPEVVREELYRTSTDPGEHTDMSERHPEQLAAARAALAALRARCSPPSDDVGPAPEIPAAEAERLRALGYL